MMQVGFAGLGRMGMHMARNLARAGHDLTVWNRSRAKAEALAAEIGCEVAGTPRELATRTDVVVTMLADDPSSALVHFGADGLFSGKGANHFIEMGTMSPDHIAELVRNAPAGTVVLDAPVSGAIQAAEAAELMIMVGSDAPTAAPLRPLFEAIGKRTIFLGKTGAGAVMKLAVNSLIHGINQALAEAMNLVEEAGIAPRIAFDTIEASAACAPMLKYRRPLYLDEASHAVTFTVALARKDMEMTIALAERFGVPMPQARVTLHKLKQAEEAGYDQRDMASMLDFMKGKNT
ncbi:NAD(P)-dependent oxidoreductase [Chelativorans intermedius]|uniref:NAD(P)-dependent oxidoreductase n=1 Tax=Chelativorans intermedius TaxID=515947 RepID=A0ABV6D2K7_9HYPH|nr:NAD(P)-dependent oxidoreductase [Chelativorans intermedius]MCT8997335.1 NAD(P)-dependent oxidoreductase [Chelativorans intermedius]